MSPDTQLGVPRWDPGRFYLSRIPRPILCEIIWYCRKLMVSFQLSSSEQCVFRINNIKGGWIGTRATGTWQLRHCWIRGKVWVGGVVYSKSASGCFVTFDEEAFTSSKPIWWRFLLPALLKYITFLYENVFLDSRFFLDLPLPPKNL